MKFSAFKGYYVTLWGDYVARILNLIMYSCITSTCMKMDIAEGEWSWKWFGLEVTVKSESPWSIIMLYLPQAVLLHRFLWSFLSGVWVLGLSGEMQTRTRNQPGGGWELNARQKNKCADEKSCIGFEIFQELCGDLVDMMVAWNVPTRTKQSESIRTKLMSSCWNEATLKRM